MGPKIYGRGAKSPKAFKLQVFGLSWKGLGPIPHGMGLKIHGMGFKIHGMGPKIYGMGPAIHGLGLKIHGTGPRIFGMGPKIYGRGAKSPKAFELRAFGLSWKGFRAHSARNGRSNPWNGF